VYKTSNFNLLERLAWLGEEPYRATGKGNESEELGREIFFWLGR
jgi:hypothetical protein